MKITPYCLLCFFIFSYSVASGAEQKDDNAGVPDKPEKASFSDSIKGSDLHDGLIRVYRHRDTGEVQLGIRPEQLDQQFIYVTMTSDGVVEGGHFRGQYRENTVLTLRRHFDRIEFVKENTNFYFNPDSPLAKSASANISAAVLATQKIVATDDNSGELLIKADDIFLKEALHPIKPTPAPDFDPKKAFDLGKLSGDKNKIYEIKNYPNNTDVWVEYVYENPAPMVHGGADIVDSRYVSIRMQHMFIALPDNEFVPRADDPRVGYFLTRSDDLTDASHTPYRDFITRWNLEKQDPDAEVSEPKTPITWWIENTTPLEWRDLIRKAALSWNSSFEKAGFRNAIEVRVQPDEADWDAGDIRYNVLRWTSSPQPPFGGYGPSFVNPLTGQILGADIMLEYSFMTNRIRLESLLKTLNSGGVGSPAPGMHCSLGHSLQLSSLFGQQVLQVNDAPASELAQLRSDAMHYLIIHEIGHTLGLNHNMRASNSLDAEQIFNAAAVEENALLASVMDYPAINVAHPGKPQTRYFSNKPGAYDDWAISFGYSPDVDDPRTRRALLERSTEPMLAFGNDADDMRSAGKAIDPRVNIFDLSSDGLGHAIARIELINAILDKLLGKYSKEGEFYQELHNAYLILASQFQASANVISRYIGGVHVERTTHGQEGAVTPFTPVASTQQKRAMQALAEHVFAVNAFAGDEALYRHLQQQRRGFDFFNTTEDPKIQQVLLAVQSGLLEHLLHPNVQQRLTNSGLYGNSYSTTEMMDDLTNAIFTADSKSDVTTSRQQVQLEYVNRLLAMVSGASRKTYDYPAQSAALYSLRKIESMIGNARRGSLQTRAHKQNIRYTIRRGLDE